MAITSVNQKILDSIITQDVLTRRVTAGVEREVQKRIDKLEVDLKAAMEATAVWDTQNVRVRIRRQRKLKLRTQRLIAAAMADCNAIVHDSMTRVAAAKAKMAHQVLDEHIP